MRKVEVCPYNEKWVSLFEEEADHLRHIFDEQMVAIYHIGSTSVPGLKAKPIIDIMPVVKNIHRVDPYNSRMKELGYEPKGENGIGGRRYFQKGGDHRSHHIHIYEQGNSNIDRHLAFRDFLRTHPDVNKQYGELKEKLAQQFPYDIGAYIAGKEKLVLEIERQALEWYGDGS